MSTITPVPDVDQQPIEFKTERQLAQHLKKTYGEAPIGSELTSLLETAQLHFFTRAEQDAVLADAINSLIEAQKKREPAEMSGLAGEWNRRCKQSDDVYPLMYGSIGSKLDTFSDDRPAWSNSVYDFVGNLATEFIFQSEPILATTLQLHPGTAGKGGINLAYAELQIRRPLPFAEPFIALRKFAVSDADRADGNTSPKLVKTGTYRVTLDEAAQLAHALLFAIDVARGTSEDVGQVPA